MKHPADSRKKSATQTKSKTAHGSQAAAIQSEALLAAWDLYADGNWQALLDLESDRASAPGEDVADLIAAGRYEFADGAFDPGVSTGGDKSLFGALRDGLSACYRHEYPEAADLLGRWLSERDYYAASILRRFVDAALSGARYRLLGEVCKRFVGKPALQQIALEGFFLSNFHLERHKEAVLVFEKFREHFDDAILLQKAALSLMRLGRYQEAEALLAPLCAQLSGADFQMRYEEVRESYSQSIQNRAKLAKKSNRSFEESMELGMAYLFSGEYDRALEIFQGLMNSRAA